MELKQFTEVLQTAESYYINRTFMELKPSGWAPMPST